MEDGTISKNTVVEQITELLAGVNDLTGYLVIDNGDMHFYFPESMVDSFNFRIRSAEIAQGVFVIEAKHFFSSFTIELVNDSFDKGNILKFFSNDADVYNYLDEKKITFAFRSYDREIHRYGYYEAIIEKQTSVKESLIAKMDVTKLAYEEAEKYETATILSFDDLDVRNEVIGTWSFNYDKIHHEAVVNEAFCNILGIPKAKTFGISRLPLMFDLDDEESRNSKAQLSELNLLASRGVIDTFSVDLKVRKHDTNEFVYIKDITTVYDRFLDHAIRHAQGIFIDITEEKTKTKYYENLYNRLSFAEQIGNFGSWMIDSNESLDSMLISSKGKYLLGLFEMSGDKLSYDELCVNFLSSDGTENISNEFRDFLIGKSDYIDLKFYINLENSIRWLKLEGVFIDKDAEGRVIKAVGTLQDITKEQLEIIRTRELYYTDELTGLPNREKLFLDYEKGDFEGQYFVYGDLRNFKSINDTYGHSIGNIMLRAFAERISKYCDIEDRLYRLYGDEFIFILKLQSSDSIVEALNRFFDFMAEPYDVNKERIELQITLGVIENFDNTLPLGRLLKQGDDAMYMAKRLGKDYYVVGPEWIQKDYVYKKNEIRDIYELETVDLLIKQSGFFFDNPGFFIFGQFYLDGETYNYNTKYCVEEYELHDTAEFVHKNIYRTDFKVSWLSKIQEQLGDIEFNKLWEDYYEIFTNFDKDEFDVVFPYRQKGKFNRELIRMIGRVHKRDDNGSPRMVFGTITNISTQRLSSWHRDLINESLLLGESFYLIQIKSSPIIVCSRSAKFVLGLPQTGDDTHLTKEDTEDFYNYQLDGGRSMKEALSLNNDIYIGNRDAVVYTFTYNRPDKEIRYMRMISKPFERDKDGHAIAVISYMTDVTESTTKQQELTELNNFYNLAIAAGKMGAWNVEIDEKGNPKNFNYSGENFLELFGIDSDSNNENVLNKAISVLDESGDESWNSFKKELKSITNQQSINEEVEKVFKIYNKTLDEYRYIKHRIRSIGIKSSVQKSVAGVLYDVTDRYLMQERYRYLAFNDGLTNLPNRDFLYEKYRNGMFDNRIMLYIDIINFKEIKGMYGHAVSDQVLREFSARIQQIVKDRKNVAKEIYHLYSSEFIIFCDTIKVSNIESEIHNFLMKLKLPYEIRDFNVIVDVKMGVVPHLSMYRSIDEILQVADKVMYIVHRSNEDFYILRKEYSVYDLEFEINNRLSLGINEDEVIPYFQPITDCNQNIVGVELLARWIIDGKIIEPIDFIDLAIRKNKISEIDSIVTKKGLFEFKQLIEEKLISKDSIVTVNISDISLLQKRMIDYIAYEIKENKLKPGQVAIEISEKNLSSLFDNTQVIKELRSIGVLIALDDFSSGNSSLNTLRFDICDIIKIDKLLLWDAVKDQEINKVFDFFNQFFTTQGMTVIIEGVETKKQVGIIPKNKSTYAQGDHFAKAMSIEKLRDFLKNKK